jgi:hypothetical protein
MPTPPVPFPSNTNPHVPPDIGGGTSRGITRAGDIRHQGDLVVAGQTLNPAVAGKLDNPKSNDGTSKAQTVSRDSACEGSDPWHTPGMRG